MEEELVHQGRERRWGWRMAREGARLRSEHMLCYMVRLYRQ